MRWCKEILALKIFTCSYILVSFVTEKNIVQLRLYLQNHGYFILWYIIIAPWYYKKQVR